MRTQDLLLRLCETFERIADIMERSYQDSRETTELLARGVQAQEHTAELNEKAAAMVARARENIRDN
jgi:hypothetical protein